MIKIKYRHNFSIIPFLLLLLVPVSVYSMGLRSLVALPVETSGAVIRLGYEHNRETRTETLTSSLAYGINSKDTLLVGLPHQLSPKISRAAGDLSLLYRHISYRNDKPTGTDRLGLLAGAVIPTANNRDSAVQAGVVFTHFESRHEIDLDAVYQAGLDRRKNSGRYDISWQYRLFPNVRPDWGLSTEINNVLELNGRWQQNNRMTHQITAGIQWIHPSLVLEAGLVKDLNNRHEQQTIFSLRFHF